MTALPCPACGYDVRPDLERMKRLVSKLERRSVVVDFVGKCPSCTRFLSLDDGLSLDGVGPERLVLVEVGA